MELQSDESVISDMAAMQSEHNPLSSNHIQQINCDASYDIADDTNVLINEGYITTTHADVIDSNGTGCDDEDDSEMMDKPLIIDEDYNTEDDLTLAKDTLDTLNVPSLFSSETNTLNQLEIGKNKSLDDFHASKDYLVDHDYFSGILKDRFKTNNVSSCKTIFQNKNIVVMQDLLSEKYDWQKSVQEKFFQQSNHYKDTDVENSDYTNATVNANFDDMNRFRETECYADIDHNYTKTDCHKDVINNQKNNINKDMIIEETVQKQRENQQTVTLTSLVQTKSTENVSYNAVALQNSVCEGKHLKKSSRSICPHTSEKKQDFSKLESKSIHKIRKVNSQSSNLGKLPTRSSYPQKQLQKSLKQTTGEPVLILVPLVSRLNLEKYCKNNSEQSLNKCTQAKGFTSKVKVKESILDWRKIAVLKKGFLKSKQQEINTGKKPEVAVASIGNSLVVKKCHSKSSLWNSNKSLGFDKKQDAVLKSQVRQVTNRNRNRKDKPTPAKTVKISDNVDEVKSVDEDCLVLEKSTSGKRVSIRAREMLVDAQTEKCTESVTPDLDSDNPFDRYITELTPDVRTDIKKTENHKPEDCSPHSVGVSDIESQDPKPDLNDLANDSRPEEGAAGNESASGSVELKILKCKECCSVFNDVTSFDLHLIWCDVEAKKSKICGVCRVAFPDLKSLNVHDCLHVKHNVDYTCGVCKKVFFNDSSASTASG